MLRTIGAALLAATAVFFWGFLYWTIMPMGASAVQGPENAAEVQKYLADQLPSSGMYMVPYSDAPESDTAYHQAHKRGPLALIQFRERGAEPMSPGVMIQGWMHGLFSFLLMAIAIQLVVRDGGFGARFLVGFGGGVAGSVFSTFSNPIWWYQPWSFATTQFVYQLVSWFIAALVLASILRSGGARPDPNRL